MATKGFSEAELNELIAFYKSPLGQKVLKQMPALFSESMKMTQSKLGTGGPADQPAAGTDDQRTGTQEALSMSMQQRIRQALEALQADFLQVEDESHLHSRGLESHFKVVVVSPWLKRSMPSAATSACCRAG